MKVSLYKEIVTYLSDIIKNTIYENHVYTVGGCCRDEFLGNDIKDIDIVIDLPNGGISFAEWLYNAGYLNGHIVSYPTYGTSMFKLQKYPDIELEAVQTRSEKYTKDSRKPSTDYGTIQEDCFRRDLTINALYYNISTHTHLDVCGQSINDIKQHIIRTPCDPNITYIDDPLRIMRCVRFAARYNWFIDPVTYYAMCSNIDRLSIISAERITDEFNKIISNESIVKVFNGLNTLWSIGAFKYIFPELTINPSYLFNSINSAYLTTFESKLALICIQIINNEQINQSLYNRKYSADTIKHINKVIKLSKIWGPKWETLKQYSNKKLRHHRTLKMPFIREFVYNCGNEQIKQDVIKIISVLSPHYRVMSTIAKIRNCNFYDYKLPINGDDIIKLGYKPGRIISTILSNLLDVAFIYPNITKHDCIELIKSEEIFKEHPRLNKKSKHENKNIKKTSTRSKGQLLYTTKS